MKILHLTDSHLSSASAVAFERFRACIEHILVRHSDASLCVVTGDIADRAEPECYAFAERMLARLPMPVLATAGNHDRRDTMRVAFPESITADGFFQSRHQCGAVAVLVLDTLDEGMEAGKLCIHRRSWIEDQLKTAQADRLIVFLHHAPRSLGMPPLDAICLQDDGWLLARLNDYPGRVHIAFGHVHRPISGIAGSVSFNAQPGLSSRFRLDFESLALVAEEGLPGYGVMLVTDDALITHVEENSSTCSPN